MPLYPENTTAGIEDFRSSGWKTAISSPEVKGYGDMAQGLSKAATSAIEAGNSPEGKVLSLLADACSMMLMPNSINEPFKPWMVLSNWRSPIPEDLEADIDLLSQISEEIDDAWLRARLADLAWLLKRSYKSALLAIDAYRAIPLEDDTWAHGGQECWERAISLCRTLGPGSGKRIEEMESAIVSGLECVQRQDLLLASGLSTLLLENGLGVHESATIAPKVEAWARVLDDEEKHIFAREFFGAAVEWYKLAGDQEKAYDLITCIAESWIKEAGSHSSHAVVASFYENAIQTYRTIPKTQRAPRKLDDRLAEIHAAMGVAGEKALGETGRISSSVDISDLVEKVRNQVTGRSATEAIFALANIHSGARVKSLRRQSEEMLKAHPLQSLFSSSHLSKDGRVIAKCPGMDWSNTNSEAYHAVIWSQMVKSYSLELGVSVQGLILPALEVIVREHRLRQNDFISLADQSPIVPQNRDSLFGKGLFLGYEQDFVTALHILVPQIENMVRYHLKAAGVKTTNLDSAGIENENGLSALVELTAVGQVFGEDCAFELKALFCDPFGPNLRNELAHGLLGYGDCQSVYSVYAWWFALRLVTITFWNSIRKPNTADATETPENKE